MKALVEIYEIRCDDLSSLRVQRALKEGRGVTAGSFKFGKMRYATDYPEKFWLISNECPYYVCKREGTYR